MTNSGDELRDKYIAECTRLDTFARQMEVDRNQLRAQLKENRKCANCGSEEIRKTETLEHVDRLMAEVDGLKAMLNDLQEPIEVLTRACDWICFNVGNSINETTKEQYRAWTKMGTKALEQIKKMEESK